MGFDLQSLEQVADLEQSLSLLAEVTGTDVAALDAVVELDPLRDPGPPRAVGWCRNGLETSRPSRLLKKRLVGSLLQNGFRDSAKTCSRCVVNPEPCRPWPRRCGSCSPVSWDLLKVREQY